MTEAPSVQPIGNGARGFFFREGDFMGPNPSQDLKAYAAFFLLAFFYLAWFCKYGLNVADEGLPLSGAIRVLNGDTPMVDFQSYPPGRFYLYVLIYKIFGANMLAVRLVVSFFTAAAALMIFIASGNIMSRPFALLAAMIFLVGPGTYYARYIPFFTAFSILVFAQYFAGRKYALQGLGFVGGLTCLFRYDVGAFLLCAAFFVLALKNFHEGRWRNVFREGLSLALGVVVVLVPVVLAMAVEGYLWDFIALNLKLLLGGYQKIALPFPRFNESPWDEWLIFYVPLFVYAVAFSALLYAGLKKKIGGWDFFILYVLALGVVTFNQAIWRTQPENIVKVMIPAEILFALLGHRVYAGLPTLKLKATWGILILTLPVLFGHTMLTKYKFYLGSAGVAGENYKRLDVDRGGIYPAKNQATVYREVVRYIQTHTEKDDPIYVTPFIGHPLYFLSERSNPGFFEWILLTTPLMYPNTFDRLAKSLETSGVDVIVYFEFALDNMEDRRLKNFFPEFYNYLFDRYYLDRMIGNFMMLRKGGGNIAAMQTIMDAFSGEVKGAISLGQDFVARKDNLHRILVRTIDLTGAGSGDFVLHLMDGSKNGKELARATARVADTVVNEWLSFDFPALPDSSGEQFYFYLESSRPVDAKNLSLWYTQQDRYPDGGMYANHQPIPGDLTFIALSKPQPGSVGEVSSNGE